MCKIDNTKYTIKIEALIFILILKVIEVNFLDIIFLTF